MDQRYLRPAVETIFQNHCHGMVDVRDDGVWVIKTIPQQPGLRWTPACELDGPDAPDPLSTPSLPIPCTANHLAAFMLDGVGAQLLMAYGPLHEGPDDEMVEALGIDASKAKDAIRGAYDALRAAALSLGKLTDDLRAIGEDRGLRGTKPFRKPKDIAKIAKVHQRHHDKFPEWRKLMVRQLIGTDMVYESAAIRDERLLADREKWQKTGKRANMWDAAHMKKTGIKPDELKRRLGAARKRRKKLAEQETLQATWPPTPNRTIPKP